LLGGRELGLVNLLQATEADIATVTECEILEATGEFSLAGYTTFSPQTRAGGKTGVILLMENSLAVRANVKAIYDVMDPAVQLEWLHFSHHVICAESSQRLEILLLQIC
jgi:hypothetical protein